MNDELKKNYEIVDKTLKECEIYNHAMNIISFDSETICPPMGMEAQGEVNTFLGEKAFRLTKDPEYIKACEYIYVHQDELDNDFEKRLAYLLHKEYMQTKNITPEMNREFSDIMSKSWINWLNAKQKSDYLIFEPSLKKVKEVGFKQISLLDEKLPNVYDNMLNIYEEGMTSEKLDVFFNKCKERLVPLLRKIQNSKKVIRDDFLSRPVSDAQQQEFAKYLLNTMGFDFKKGAFTTTEHPFTSGLAKYDTRVTTHYYPNAFISSMYSIIHEGGHALFEMNQPSENHDYHITGGKTMGMHESTSRFYENVLGRSKEFIHLIYPKAKEIFPNVLNDVSEKEFYEAVNIVKPSLIRTEADEFTYTFHIIIRYEMEKLINSSDVDFDLLPKLWNQKYQELLGVTPSNDTEGILQDVHWASGFGYFPTYAIGNFYNAMYFNQMKKEIDVYQLIKEGKINEITKWMSEKVWKKADRLSPQEWIKDITGREATVDDFLDYLEKKYTELYEL